MKTVAGVFASRGEAGRAADKLRSAGLPADRIALLSPGNSRERTGPVPVSAAEQPGMGPMIGGVLGAAAGIGGGFQAAVTASALLPGVGPVLAMGAFGSALLGVAGAAVGAAAGEAIENATSEGLPEDELFVYEDALRRGRSVVIAFPKDAESASSARDLIKAAGAESVDAAREEWWIGLRSAEKEHYAGQGRNFETEEKFYRYGFEDALHARSRCKEYDQVISEIAQHIDALKQRYPGADLEESYRRGYERGRESYQSLCNKTKK